MRTLYPLTSSQQEIWFDQILHADLPIYNIGGYVKIPGPVKPELFEKAINLLIRKHDALRIVLTADTDEDGVPLQAFLESLTITVPMHDLSTASDPHKSASAWMQERFTQPFKLIEHPLFRYDLIKLAEDNYYWLLQYHHLIIDGWGTALLNRSLANIYTQLVNNNSPDLSSPSYTSFIENDRTYIASKTFEKNSHYWASKFTNIPDPLITPRQSSPTSKALESDREAIFLSQNFYQQLNILAKK
ncbi:hypothetical protein KAI46_08065, partial [bacterium]|nr:hypothetical protein [bacterium]